MLRLSVLVLLCFATLSANPSYAKLGSAIVLQYHKFGVKNSPSTNISMDLFKQHMNYLHDNNYTVMKLSTIITKLKNNQKLPQKCVAITIDDAYKNVFTRAYPLLKKYHFPATIFVNTRPVLNHSKSFMSWEDMRVMGEDGSEFANHTHTHQYLVRIKRENPTLHLQKVREEIVQAEKILDLHIKKYVSHTPKMLAYPFGEYDEEIMDVLRELNYVGIAQNSGPIYQGSNFLALTRFPMSGSFGKMKSFILKLHTLPLDVTAISSEDTIVGEKNNPPHFTLHLAKPLKGLQCFTSNGEKITMNYKNKTTIEMVSKVPLKYPRDHYTCTAWYAPHRWAWYSHMWVVLKQKK